MRYGIAIAVAGLLIGAGALYVQRVERSAELRIRSALRDAKAAGQLPPDVDPETADLNNVGVGIRVSASESLGLSLAHFLRAWRFVLIPVVLLGSAAIAWMLRQRQPR